MEWREQLGEGKMKDEMEVGKDENRDAGRGKEMKRGSAQKYT